MDNIVILRNVALQVILASIGFDSKETSINIRPKVTFLYFVNDRDFYHTFCSAVYESMITSGFHFSEWLHVSEQRCPFISKQESLFISEQRRFNWCKAFRYRRIHRITSSVLYHTSSARSIFVSKHLHTISNESYNIQIMRIENNSLTVYKNLSSLFSSDIQNVFSVQTR